jgi:carbamoyl-phosphate synthase large subunit
MGRTKILITGAGAPGAAGILSSLQIDDSLSITIADKNPNAVGKYLNTKGNFWHIPDAKMPYFIDTVLYYCIKNDIKLIFPLVTLELFQFAKYKDLFKKHDIRIIVSDYEYLNIANNKSTLLKHLSSNNIPTPDFRIVPMGNFEQLLISFKDLGYPTRPLCIKPSISNGSRGVRIIDNTIDKFDILFNQKPNSLYMSFDEMCTILEGKMFPEILVSEVLPGEEYTIDTVNNNGDIKLVLPRIRTRIAGGISIEGKFVKHLDIIEYCRSILSTMTLHGPIGLQVKQDINGQFKILEINPRIQGTSVAALGVGVNLPLAVINQERGDEVNIDIDSIKWNTHFIRYWKEVFY